MTLDDLRDAWRTAQPSGGGELTETLIALADLQAAHTQLDRACQHITPTEREPALMVGGLMRI